MASEILLEINGHAYHALRFCYEFYRHTDVKGKPVTGLEGGDVHVVLESNADNSLLETMLSDKSRQVPYHSWPDFEPAPICGKIQLIRDNVEIFRELVFEEGYIYRYHESMTADGFPMSILLSISTMRLDINRNVRLDRRLLTTYGFGWMKLSNTIFKQTVKSNQSIRQKDVTPKKSTIHQEEPVVLVTSVKGESKAIVSQTVQYVVTKYNVPNVKDSDRKRVKWVMEVDGQKEYLKEQGETLDLQIKEEWQGKEIIVMPYLKQCTSNVAIKTEIERWKLPKIFARSLTLPGKSINGDTAEDMLYKDKTIEDVLSINKLFALQVKASDESLFADLIYLTSFFSTLKEGKEHGLKIVKHFRENSGTIYTSKFMNKSFAEHETLQKFIYNDGGVIDVLNRNLRATNGNINKIDIQIGVIQSTRPKFNKLYDYFNGMKVTVDGIAAYVIYIDEYKLLSPNTYNAKLRIEIYDHYGLDKRDVEKFGYVAGFRSWYILQHVRGYKPFLTKMVHILDIKEETF